MKKIFLLLLFILTYFCFSNINVLANGEETFNLEIKSKSGALIEPLTGTIIFEKNGYEELAPASMTKLMTMILVCEALDKNIISIDQKLRASKYACSMGGTQIYLKENEEMCVEDLLKSVALASANDAAIVLAEGVAGSCNSFVKMMNKKAKEIGLTNTCFKNPNGLPEEGHYSCAIDMAKMGAHLVNNYGSFILKYTSLYEDYVREDLENKFWLVNTNKLVKHVEGVDGLKTGWTEEAGYCLTCTMNKNGIRMISVIMGAETIEQRTKETLSLLNYGVSNYEVKKIYSKGDVIETLEDVAYKPTIYHIAISEDVYMLNRKGTEYIDISEKRIINYENVTNGDKIGSIKIFVDNEEIKEVDLYVLEDVKKANIFIIILEVLKEIFFIV